MPLGVTLEQQDPVLWITLERPRRLNALDADARTRIVDGLKFASECKEVRAVVIMGRGDHAFCAGQDLNESSTLAPDAGENWMDTWRRFFSGVTDCRKPIVAAINGVAAGAGLQLALMAHLRVAVPAARLLMAEVNVGLPAIAGSCLLDVHLGQSRMRELVLTGRTFTADEAADWGLVHELCEPDQLLSRAQAAAEMLADKPPVAMALNLSFFRDLLRARLSDAEEKAAIYQSEAIATGEPQVAMQQFLVRRNTWGAPTPT